RGNDGGAVSVFSDKFLKLKISSFPQGQKTKNRNLNSSFPQGQKTKNRNLNSSFPQKRESRTQGWRNCFFR
ncbi:hypothetical protein, partial [Neisseria meningitidis]|uniref:hypothetical protein n=2 Tax=Neisseria meningitidis TaxID=487 RepID=UPI0019D64382